MSPPPAIADYPLDRPLRPLTPPAKAVPRQIAVRQRVIVRRAPPEKDFLQRLREAGL